MSGLSRHNTVSTVSMGMVVNQQEVTDWDAHTLSQALHRRVVSCREVMQAYLARIARLNPHCNALVNLADEASLLRQADERDAELARGASRGWMHGMPQAIKDTGHAVGFPTTYGCTVLRNAVASQDSLMTARMKAAGCIVIAKTNMPEFGLGSHTFNTLFGTTANAWDPKVSAGGSSGDTAVALAHRLLPVADGSDFMGSLRNPAAWNHIFGLRPSQGRVPFVPSSDVWVSQLGTEGPMARTVQDLARLLTVQSGPDPRSPLALGDRPDFAAAVANSRPEGLRDLRIGWLGDLQGHLPMQDGILALCEQALQTFASAGAQVEPLSPNFDAEAVWSTWLVWRRALVGPKVASVLAIPGAREQVKAEALWEHDQAQGLSFMDFMRASEARTQFLQHMLALLSQVDVLALPTCQVWPFPVEQRWPTEIAGRRMDTYHRWMEVTLYATLAGLPAISLPAGFDPSGRWPGGLQLIGKPQAEAELLRIAAAYEQINAPLLRRRPAEPTQA